MNYDKKPISYDELIRDLKELGLKKGDNIIVHCSMKQIGFVIGGAEVIVRAILDIIGSEGTLMAPSQTWKNLDPTRGVHWLEPVEWWNVIRDSWPAFDRDVTPSIGMGQVAEMVRTWPNSNRSNHPVRSFAAVGKSSEDFTAKHDLVDIFGIQSPLGKLYKNDGKVLLLGVDYDKCTSLHLAETMADYDKLYIKEVSAIMEEGRRKRVEYVTLDVDDSDFVELGRVYEEERGIELGKVGNGSARYLNQKDLVDFAKTWFEENRL